MRFLPLSASVVKVWP